MLTVTENAWLVCPRCGNRRLKRIFPNESAGRVGVYCRDCKQTVFITITRGQCFESRSQ